MTGSTDDLVLVTGADGFVGARAVRLLAAEGCRVRALAHRPQPVRIGDLLSRVEYVAADLTDPGVLPPLLNGVRRVLHFAARGVSWNPQETFEDLVATNLLGTWHLVTAAGAAGVAKVVVAGSVFEYGRHFGRSVTDDLGPASPLSPLNLYGVTKAASTLLAPHAGDAAGVETETLRIFSPYGPGEPPGRFLPSVLSAALRSEPVRMTEGLQERDFCYVDDVARAFVSASRTLRGSHGVYNLGTGRALSLRDAAKTVVDLVGSPSPIQAGALPYRPDEAFRLVADPTGLPEDLASCLATPFREGVSLMAAWWRATPSWWRTP